jgi:hypothetical protein
LWIEDFRSLVAGLRIQDSGLRIRVAPLRGLNSTQVTRRSRLHAKRVSRADRVSHANKDYAG